MTTPSTPARFIDRLDSATRKMFPMCTGLIDYAPDALAAIAFISWFGNNKHNPGEPLHHARGKSMDHSDCEVRHLSTRGDIDPAYVGTPVAEVAHMAEKAWRAILELQEAMEQIYDLPLPRGARAAPTVAEAVDDVIRAGGTDPEDDEEDEAEGGFTHLPPRRPSDLTPAEERATALRIHQSSADCKKPKACALCDAMALHALDSERLPIG